MGGALRRYRENLGYTLEDAAQVLQCDRSKIGRIETGQRGIRPRELRGLLSEYGVGEQQQAILAVMTDSRGGHGWHETYADVLPGAWRDYVALEATASRVLCYEAQRVPALLQTPAYARALAEADPGLAGSEAARDRAVEATLARQKAILGERKPDVHVIIGEAALHQRVGGAAVIEGQFRVLAGFAGDSGMVTVQILTSESGAHAAAAVGSLAMLEFADAPGLNVVHLGGVGGGVCLVAQEDIAAYAGLRARQGTRAQSGTIHAAATRAGRPLTHHVRLCHRASRAVAQARQVPYFLASGRPLPGAGCHATSPFPITVFRAVLIILAAAAPGHSCQPASITRAVAGGDQVTDLAVQGIEPGHGRGAVHQGAAERGDHAGELGELPVDFGEVAGFTGVEDGDVFAVRGELIQRRGDRECLALVLQKR